MVLSDHLSPENVFIGLAASSKEDLIEKLAKRGASLVGLATADVIKALQSREVLGSTGIGRGIALPHAAVDGLTKSVFLFARLAKPIAFDAVDDLDVDIAVMVLTPPVEQGQNLNLLSCAARRLRDDDVLSALRAARTADEAYFILTSSDQA